MQDFFVYLFAIWMYVALFGSTYLWMFLLFLAGTIVWDKVFQEKPKKAPAAATPAAAAKK